MARLQSKTKKKKNEGRGSCLNSPLSPSYSTGLCLHCLLLPRCSGQWLTISNSLGTRREDLPTRLRARFQVIAKAFWSAVNWFLWGLYITQHPGLRKQGGAGAGGRELGSQSRELRAGGAEWGQAPWGQAAGCCSTPLGSLGQGGTCSKARQGEGTAGPAGRRGRRSGADLAACP